jgi:ATP-binding cassette, subfamily B, bacterial PglK
MEAVDNIRGNKTIILIAHRLSTVRNCHFIFLMERGRVVACGTYDELVANNEIFRRMAAGG